MEVFALLATPVSMEPVRPLHRVQRAGSAVTVIVAHAQAEPTAQTVPRCVLVVLQRHAPTTVSVKVMAHAHASTVSPEMIAV